MLDLNPVIFLGPPGTGKTTALLNIVDEEMQNGVAPDRIGYMTFTRKGVEEAITRASEQFNLPRERFRYFNTLHSAAFRHLGMKTGDIFTGHKVGDFAKEYGYEIHGGLSSDDGTYTNFVGDDIVLFFENYARITRQPVELILSQHDYIVPDFTRSMAIISNLHNYKQKKGLLDFTDMIEEFISLNAPPRLEVLIVDEAQDLSELQWEMVEVLAQQVERLYIAGDDDQTIYGWAGASSRFISMPGEVRLLSQSFRVPALIHARANEVIERVDNRRKKLWMPRQAQGQMTWCQNIDELDPKQLDMSVMMLGRTVKLIRNRFVPWCRANGLPYRYFDAHSIKPAYARAITSWNDLQNGYTIPISDAVKIYSLLPSENNKRVAVGIAHGSKAKLNRLEKQGDAPDISLKELQDEYGLNVRGKWREVFTEIDPRDADYIQRVIDNGYNLVSKPSIHISTIHRVKGGQADKVIMLSETAKLADKFATNQDDEARVFYTGITRAFEELVIIHPERRYHFDGLLE
jgi:DNA helicase-2/ATP-dependent DNA helicase PcrA